MFESQRFREVIGRIRTGDEAAAELVRLHEPASRRVVRIRLVKARLERLFDAMDNCESVLGSFGCVPLPGSTSRTSPDSWSGRAR